MHFFAERYLADGCRARAASSGTVLLLDAAGNPRRLTSNDLAGTSITLGAIRAMLMRRFGGGSAMNEEEDEDGDEVMEEDDSDEDMWGCVRAL